jgi:pre-mRNA-processing factor 8
MVPDNHIWNYNFVGLGLNSSMKYSLILANPKEFYHENHRTSHFIKFAGVETNELETAESDDFF